MENNPQTNPAPPIQSGQTTSSATPQATTPPLAPQSPAMQPTQKDGTNKLTMITIGIVLLGLGLLGGYFIANNLNPTSTTDNTLTTISPTAQPTVEPTIDPTADWKSYTNPGNTYTVKFPSDTLLQYICPNEELTLAIRKDETEESKTMPTCARGGRYDIEIVTLTQTFTEPQSSTNYSVTKQATAIDGLPATRYITKLIQQPANGDMSIPYSQDIYVTKSGKTYLLHVGSEELQSTFDEIIATFKFLK